MSFTEKEKGICEVVKNNNRIIILIKFRMMINLEMFKIYKWGGAKQYQNIFIDKPGWKGKDERIIIMSLKY